MKSDPTAKGRARCPQRAAGPSRRAGLLYAKVCEKREDFGDATGARTFLSAAAPEYSTGSKRSRALLPFDVAADKNVRAPLWFRLRRPGDSAPYLRRHPPAIRRIAGSESRKFTRNCYLTAYNDLLV